MTIYYNSDNAKSTICPLKAAVTVYCLGSSQPRKQTGLRSDSRSACFWICLNLSNLIPCSYEVDNEKSRSVFNAWTNTPRNFSFSSKKFQLSRICLSMAFCSESSSLSVQPNQQKDGLTLSFSDIKCSPSLSYLKTLTSVTLSRASHSSPLDRPQSKNPSARDQR